MKNESKKTRTECDLLGCVEVPDNVLYGVQTMRGLENFAISKFRLCEYPRFIEGLAIVKLGAAVEVKNITDGITQVSCQISAGANVVNFDGSNLSRGVYVVCYVVNSAVVDQQKVRIE